MKLNKRQVERAMKKIGGMPLHTTPEGFYKAIEIGAKERDYLGLPEEMNFITLHGHKGGEITGYALKSIIEPYIDRVRREKMEEKRAKREQREREKAKK